MRKFGFMNSFSKIENLLVSPLVLLTLRVRLLHISDVLVAEDESREAVDGLTMISPDVRGRSRGGGIEADSVLSLSLI